MAGVRGRSGGHNRKSLMEHRLAGTFRKGRHGHLVDIAPPANPAAVTKPDTLSVAAAKVWDALAPVCSRLGTLTATDVWAFSTLCELQATHEAVVALKSKPGFQPVLSGGRPDPVFRLEREGAAALRPYYEMFGLTAGARVRLHVQSNDGQQPAGKLERFRRPPSKWADALK